MYEIQQTLCKKMNDIARKYLELSSIIGQPIMRSNEVKATLIYNDMFINVEYMFTTDKYRLTNSIDDVEIFTTTLHDLQEYIHVIVNTIHSDRV